MEARNILINSAVFHNGDWEKMYKAIVEKNIVDVVNTTDTNAITILDSNYPKRLREIYKPPFVLFYKGDIDLLKNDNIISVCIMREPTNEGLGALKTIASGIDVGICDRNLDYIKRPIVVLPHGLDKDSTTISDVLARGGLVLSEYPLGVEKTKDTCLARNRIIEGIAHKTLLIEAFGNSSSLIRVNYALQFNHDVFVVPHSIGVDFINNDLIADGAIICTKSEQLYEE